MLYICKQHNPIHGHVMCMHSILGATVLDSPSLLDSCRRNVALVFLLAVNVLGDMRARGNKDQTRRLPPAYPVYPDDSTYVFIPINTSYIDLG